MVRQISAAALTKLSEKLSPEPATIIEIQWVDGGSIYTYSDKNLGGKEGKILQVSGLDNTVVIQGVQAGGSGDSQQIQVTLDDTDGIIKTIMDSHDIHKEPAWVYQWFEELDLDDKFLIFKGQISSPLQWNEGDRTVSFDIITRIEDAEVGFSMEEGNFDYIPEDLVGEPWPLIFGTVRTCEALKTRSPRKGFLETGFGIRDYMLAPKKEQAGEVCCPWRFVGFRSFYDQGSGAPWGVGELNIEPVYERDVNCVCKVRAIQCEMDLNIAKQSQFEYGTINIRDGEFFPQDQFIVLDIQGAKIGGKFTGTPETPSKTFNISNRRHPKLVEGEPVVPEIRNFGCDPFPLGLATDTNGNTSIGTQVCILPDDCDGWGSGLTFGNIINDLGDSKEQQAWSYLSTFEEAGFFWADPNSEVLLDTDNELVYIANLLPSTVHYVKAWRTFEVSNFRQFTTVPNTYYTVRQSDFNGYTTTEIVFDRPLSSRGEGWEDDIFVSLTSSVGPNPVDIMEWLITKYTSFTWDGSFATVKTDVDNYPMNFKVPGRMNIFKLLQEMAFQGRMALVLRNDEFHLIYLSEEPDEDETIIEDDVLENSLVLDHTSTEDIVTKFVAEWKPDCHLDEAYKIILRFNIERYGTQEQTFDFYCYNIQELVIKSATFWLIRMANTWRKIICKTPLTKLKLESLDGVYVTLPDIANGEIKCRVETSNYNSDDNSIDFVIQTPVRSGERDPFIHHYPKDIEILEIHPTNDDLRDGKAGSGPNVDVEAPQGHVLGDGLQLAQGFSFGQKSPCEGFSDNPAQANLSHTRPIDIQGKCRSDQGDSKPSDQDDEKPSTQLDEDNAVISDEQSPVNEKTKGEKDSTRNDLIQEGRTGDLGTQINNNLNTGTGGTGGAGGNGGAGGGGNPNPDGPSLHDQLKDLPDEDDLKEKNKCFYTLQIFYLNPVDTVNIPEGQSCIIMGEPTICNPPPGLTYCKCSEPGKTGCWVGNQVPNLNEKFHFDTQLERNQALATVEQIIDSEATVGLIHPVFTVSSQHTPAGCEPADDPEKSGIIGYEGSDPDKTIVGLYGFMTDNFMPNSKCFLTP